MVTPLAVVLILGVLTPAALLVEDGSSDAVPPIPRPEFVDVELGKQFAEAVELLEKGDYKAAKDLFRRLKSKAKRKEEKEAVARGLKEAEGGVLLEKGNSLADKGRLRKAIASLEKIKNKYADTLIGVEIVERFEQLKGELFFVVADFETDAGGEDDEDASKEEKGKDDGEKPGGKKRPGGKDGDGKRTDYGANTKVIQGTPKEQTVRKGQGALTWRTSKYLTAISFPEVQDKLAEYRYLNFSIRSENPTERPNVIVLLDCLELRGMGRGGGRRGAAWVHQRDGYHQNVTPTGKWKDYRLDLRKFVKKGEVVGAVVALRFVHMPGVGANLYFDEISLEKE